MLVPTHSQSCGRQLVSSETWEMRVKEGAMMPVVSLGCCWESC